MAFTFAFNKLYTFEIFIQAVTTPDHNMCMQYCYV